jgi:hypothetical protein
VLAGGGHLGCFISFVLGALGRLFVLAVRAAGFLACDLSGRHRALSVQLAASRIDAVNHEIRDTFVWQLGPRLTPDFVVGWRSSSLKK